MGLVAQLVRDLGFGGLGTWFGVEFLTADLRLKL